MCMQFRLTRRDVVVIAAVSVILSPILIPAGIIYGAGVATAVGAEAASRGVKNAKKRYKARKEIDEQGPSRDQLKAALQKLADAVSANPCFQTLLEFGMGVMLAKDYLSAATLLTRAAAAAGSDKPSLLNALYYKAFCLQQCSRFGEAADVFGEARTVAASIAAANLEQPAAPSMKLSEADCLAAQAYSSFLQHTKDFPTTAFRKDFGERLLNMISKAIEMKGAASADADFFAYRAWIGFRLASRDGESDFEQHPADLPLLERVLDDIVRCESLSDAIEESIPSELLALKSHTLFLLGHHEESKAAYRQLKEADESAYCVDVTYEGVHGSWLVSDWPRPRATRENVNSFHPHDLKETRFGRPTWCDVCRKFITLSQNLDKCFECRHCDSRCHRECKDTLMLQGCWRAAGVEEVLAHKHILKKRFTHSLHNCLVCEGNILMFQDVLQCTTCQSFFHEKCAAAHPNTVIES